MERRRRVVLYGSSLFMAGVQVSLQPFPDLDICAVKERGWHALQPLIGKQVDAVVFDLTNGQPEFVLELLKHHPAVVLIGVDPTNDYALVLSSQQPQVLTMQDLVQAINGPPIFARRVQGRGVESNRQGPFIAAWRAWLCAQPRKQKVALALAVTGLCIALVLGSLLVIPQWKVPFVASIISGMGAPGVGLAFGVGIVLGGTLIGLWFLACRKRESQGS